MIQAIVTLLIDYTGVVDDMFTPIVRWITGSKVGEVGKPLSCSKCMTFWTCLAYLLAVHQFGFLSLLVTLVLACTTDLTLALFLLVKDGIGWVIEQIESIL